MHILLVHNVFPTPRRPQIVGGAEVVVRRYAEAMVAAGHRVSVARALPPGETMPVEEVAGVAVHSIPIRLPYWPFGDDGEKHGALAKLRWHAADDIGDAVGMARVLDAVQPDVVHSHNVTGLSTGVWRAAANAARPIVHTLHDYYLTCPKTSRFRHGRRCARTCTDCRLLTLRRRRDSALVGDIVGVSGAVLGIHRDNGLFGAARHHVVPNIVEGDLSRMPATGNASVTFGFLGRITVEKGIEQLAGAFAAMQGEARLVVGGRVDEATMARLQALAAPRRIDFLGFVRPEAFFAQIDVLVVPSIWSDPFPTVILEAQRAGRPTLGSRRGGIPEAIGGEDAGWTYEPDEPDALRDLLDRVAADPAALTARSAAAAAGANRFTADAVTRRYAAVYAGALA